MINIFGGSSSRFREVAEWIAELVTVLHDGFHSPAPTFFSSRANARQFGVRTTRRRRKWFKRVGVRPPRTPEGMGGQMTAQRDIEASLNTQPSAGHRLRVSRVGHAHRPARSDAGGAPGQPAVVRHTADRQTAPALAWKVARPVFPAEIALKYLRVTIDGQKRSGLVVVGVIARSRTWLGWIWPHAQLPEVQR